MEVETHNIHKLVEHITRFVSSNVLAQGSWRLGFRVVFVTGVEQINWKLWDSYAFNLKRSSYVVYVLVFLCLF